ncbi:hypothetical protein OEA41_000129 [Lepraria neglecta]|uniref:MARVEL domain-containing protein n=1 Tax=Lepraria neglecta TaxID=209136 RepID=A0AAD9ZIM3_9LECA|nr:hypothetical protein OEA41_000129 [Lepraria neglecta]
MQIYTSDKTSPRSFPWLWFVRLPAIIFSIIVLGITASDASKWGSWECSIPSKLGYNIAVSVLSFLALIYFILATGPSPQVRLLPWFIWGQLGLDTLMFILWLAAAASSSYSCSDLCNACSAYSEVLYDTDVCFCFDNTSIFKRTYSPKPKGILHARSPRSHSSGGSGSRNSSGGGGSIIAARQAFDAIMTLLFAFCLGATIFWIIKSRQTGSTTATMAMATEKQEEAGIPAAGAVPSSNEQSGAKAENYNGQPIQQQGGVPQGTPMPYPQNGTPMQQNGGPTFISKEGASEVPPAATTEKVPVSHQ